MGLSKRAGTVCGEALGNSTSNSSSSPPLSKSSTPEASGAERQSELQQFYPCIPSCQGEPRVVASRSLYVEWEKPSGQSSRVGGRDGCLPDRVGRLLPGQPHRWLVVGGGTEPPYQQAGIASSSVCLESFLEACQRCQRSGKERQCHRSSVHQSLVRHIFLCTGQNFKGTLALVSPERNNTSGPASGRQGEPQCGLHVPPFEGLDPQPSSIQHHQSDVGSTACGSFCNEILSSVAKVFQLASRFGGRGYRCFFSRLEDFASLCSSSMVPHCSIAGKWFLPKGDASSGDSMLAHTAMVSPANGDVSRFSLSSPGPTWVPGSHPISQLQLPSSHNSSPVGRMEGLMGQLRAESISERAISLIPTTWQEKTNATYNSAWRRWVSWCASGNINPFLANIANVLEFLTEEFNAGKRYRSLNCYRSAVSSTHLPIQGFAVGKHPLVCRLLKGTYVQPAATSAKVFPFVGN